MRNPTLFVDLTATPKMPHSPPSAGYFGARPWADLFFYGKEADGLLLRESAAETNAELEALRQRLNDHMLAKKLPAWARLILLIDGKSNTAWPLRIRVDAIIDRLPGLAENPSIAVIRLNGSANETVGIPDENLPVIAFPDALRAPFEQSGKTWAEWLARASDDDKQAYSQWQDQIRVGVRGFVEERIKVQERASGIETTEHTSNATDLARADAYRKAVTAAWKSVGSDFGCFQNDQEKLARREQTFPYRLGRSNQPWNVPDTVFHEGISLHFGFDTPNRRVHLIDRALSDGPSGQDNSLFLINLIDLLASDQVWKAYLLDPSGYRRHTAEIEIDSEKLCSALVGFQDRLNAWSDQLNDRRTVLDNKALAWREWSSPTPSEALPGSTADAALSAEKSLDDFVRNQELPLTHSYEQQDARAWDAAFDELSATAKRLTEGVDATCSRIRSNLATRFSKLMQADPKEEPPDGLTLKKSDFEKEDETSSKAILGMAKAPRQEWRMLELAVKARVSELRACRPRRWQLILTTLFVTVVFTLTLALALIGDWSAEHWRLAAVPAGSYLLAAVLIVAALRWQRTKYVKALCRNATDAFQDFREKELDYLKNCQDGANAATTKEVALRNLQEIDRVLAERNREDALLAWHQQSLREHAAHAEKTLAMIDPRRTARGARPPESPFSGDLGEVGEFDLELPPQLNPHYRLLASNTLSLIRCSFGDGKEIPEMRLDGNLAVKRFTLKGQRRPS
jgi:hypothetical protein